MERQGYSMEILANGIPSSIGAALAPWYLRPELRVNSQDYEPNAGPANLLWAIQSFLVGDTLPPLLQDPLIADPAHSLGIASLVSVLLGMVFLGERLRRLQWWSMALAAVGVAVLTLRLGQVPLVALILAFIGVKLILHWAHTDISPAVPEISTPVSLGVILVVLVVVTVASLVKTRKDPTVTAHAGSITGHKRAEQEAARPDQTP